MKKQKGFTLVELAMTLLIFGLLLSLIYQFINNLYEDKAVRAGAANSQPMISNAVKVLDSNYNDLIVGGLGSTINGIKLNGMTPLNDLMQDDLSKYRIYSIQTPYLYVSKCSDLTITERAAENCSFIPGHLNSGDLVAYIVLPMSTSSVFSKMKNIIYVAQKIGDNAVAIKYDGATITLGNSKFSNSAQYKLLAKRIMQTYPATTTANSQFLLVDLNQVPNFFGGGQNANNASIDELNVGVSRLSGTTATQIGDSALSMSYNFNPTSGVNNYIKFSNFGFLRAGRTFDKNGNQIILTNQVVRAPLNLSSQTQADPDLIVNVGGILTLNGLKSNVSQE